MPAAGGWVNISRAGAPESEREIKVWLVGLFYARTRDATIPEPLFALIKLEDILTSSLLELGPELFKTCPISPKRVYARSISHNSVAILPWLNVTTANASRAFNGVVKTQLGSKSLHS